MQYDHELHRIQQNLLRRAPAQCIPAILDFKTREDAQNFLEFLKAEGIELKKIKSKRKK